MEVHGIEMEVPSDRIETVLKDNAYLRWKVSWSERINSEKLHTSVLCDIVKININNHSKFLMPCFVSNFLFNPNEDIIK